MAMCWSTYVLIVLAITAITAGIFAFWYRRKQHAYTHGVFKTPGYRELLNEQTGQFQVVKAMPVDQKPSLIDRTILMKKAKYIKDINEAGETSLMWIPRSFPDQPAS